MVLRVSSCSLRRPVKVNELSLCKQFLFLFFLSDKKIDRMENTGQQKFKL